MGVNRSSIVKLLDTINSLTKNIETIMVWSKAEEDKQVREYIKKDDADLLIIRAY